MSLSPAGHIVIYALRFTTGSIGDELALRFTTGSIGDELALRFTTGSIGDELAEVMVFSPDILKSRK